MFRQPRRKIERRIVVRIVQIFLVLVDGVAPEIIGSEDEVAGFGPAVHHELAVGEEREDVGEVKDNVAVCFGGVGRGDVGFDIEDVFRAAFWVAGVDFAGDAAGCGRVGDDFGGHFGNWRCWRVEVRSVLEGDSSGEVVV